jgi:transposase
MHLQITEGQVHESIIFEALMDGGAVHRAWGRPKLRPAIVVGDKGYSARRIRFWGRQKHVITVIPRRSNERRTGYFSKAIYRQRNVVERQINRFKSFRRLATRYEKLVKNFRSMWLVAAIFLAIR